MSESGPPTRKFQPGDEIERPHGGYPQSQRYYVLAYTRSGKILIEDHLGTSYGDFYEDQLTPKRDLEGIISKWLRTACSHIPREHNHEHCLARTLRDAGAVAEGW